MQSLKVKMASMFKIECNGAFKEGRTLALLSSMVTHNIQNIDMSIISSDGVTIPANKSVIAMQSRFIAQVHHQYTIIIPYLYQQTEHVW